MEFPATEPDAATLSTSTIVFMSRNRKRLFIALKCVLALAIIVAVGREFARTLAKPELASFHFSLRFEYLLPAGLLYLLAHCSWGSFWVRLLHSQGVKVSWYTGMRAYFVSQFGKYIPGKGFVIVMRVGMLRGVGGRALPVAVTATYETLTNMAAGALVGVMLLPWLGVLPQEVSRNTTLLFAIAGLPIVLVLLNRLVVRIASKSREPDAPPLPSPSVWLLLEGLLHGAVGWCLLGLSLGLTIRAVLPDAKMITAANFDGAAYLGNVATVSLAYVVGFVVLVAPGGLGPREFVLKLLLAPRFLAAYDADLANGLAAVVALVLRLTWTAFEVVLATGLYAVRPKPHASTIIPGKDHLDA